MQANANVTPTLPSGNWVTGDEANTVKLLMGQLDLGSYDNLIKDMCVVFDKEAGKCCARPNIVPRFTFNSDLRTISVYPERKTPLLALLKCQYALLFGLNPNLKITL
jgi:hypothetical protein